MLFPLFAKGALLLLPAGITQTVQKINSGNIELPSFVADYFERVEEIRSKFNEKCAPKAKSNEADKPQRIAIVFCDGADAIAPLLILGEESGPCAPLDRDAFKAEARLDKSRLDEIIKDGFFQWQNESGKAINLSMDEFFKNIPEPTCQAPEENLQPKSSGERIITVEDPMETLFLSSVDETPVDEGRLENILAKLQESQLNGPDIKFIRPKTVIVIADVANGKTYLCSKGEVGQIVDELSLTPEECDYLARYSSSIGFSNEKIAQDMMLNGFNIRPDQAEIFMYHPIPDLSGFDVNIRQFARNNRIFIIADTRIFTDAGVPGSFEN